MNRNILNRIEQKLSERKGGISPAVIKSVFDRVPQQRYIKKLRKKNFARPRTESNSEDAIWDSFGYKFIAPFDQFSADSRDYKYLENLNEEYRTYLKILYDYLCEPRWDEGLF